MIDITYKERHKLLKERAQKIADYFRIGTVTPESKLNIIKNPPSVSESSEEKNNQ